MCSRCVFCYGSWIVVPVLKDVPGGLCLALHILLNGIKSFDD